MKLLWYSNAPWAGTGYGTQTAQVTRRLKAAGHDVAIANNYGHQAGMIQWEGIPILTMGYDGHSRDLMLAHHQAFGSDWLVTLYDTWVLPLDVFRGQRVASWVPVDHYPVPPQVVAWCREHFAIAMSKFGQTALREAGVDARYAPHAIDLSVYRPTPSDVRAELQLPDGAFLVMINAANKGRLPRKGWAEMLAAFKLLAERHDDAYLYLHTQVVAQATDGWDLPTLIGALGIPEERIRIVPQYDIVAHRIPNERMAQLYSAADVLLSTSMGEGFGLAVLEAQACGTPVIVTDFTAQPELVGAGWKVGYQPWWDFSQAAWWATPSIPQIADRLEDAYAARGDAGLSARAVEFAQDYEADLVFDRYWRPILAEMEDLLKPPLPRRVRRAKNRRKAA